MRHALHNRIGAVLPVQHPVMTWLVAHASELISAFQRGPDGKIAFERFRRKSYRRNLAEFGEKVACRIGKLDTIKKLDARWSEGIFLGVQWRTGEALIGTREGVLCSSAIRRINSARRWSTEDVLGVRGVPWHREPELEEHTQWEGLRLPQEDQADIARIPVQGETQVRRMRLKKEDYEPHGYTTGCPGCRALLRGVAPQTHSEPCRRRMEDILKESESGQRRKRVADDRINRRLARQVEEDDNKNKKLKISTEEADSSRAGPGGSVQKDVPKE